MQRNTRLTTRAFFRLLFLIPAALLLVACYQPAGNGLEATSVAFGAETFTPVPSLTPIPSDTPVPTEAAASFELVAVTNTPDPFSQASTEIAMAQGDPLLQTATAMAVLAQQFAPVAQVQDPLLQTATAMANFAVQPQAQELDPLMQSATAVIAGATATAGWPMTQTMAAILGPSPTFTLPFVPSPTWTPLPPSGTCTYTVQAGDNLFRISLAYNTTVNEIAAANGIVNPNLIIVGQVLTIPGCGGNSGQVAPTAGPAPNCAGQTYIVQQGDTMFSISMQFNVPVNSIATCNNIANPNLIFINQQLVIPSA